MPYQTVLITGGAGFIGANFIRLLLDWPGFSGRVIDFDALTYAGNLDNLAEVERRFPGRHRFIHADLADFAAVQRVFTEEPIDAVVHFAAESHVDRSILGPQPFISTNIVGTFHLLEAARTAWAGRCDVRFHHVSTDEVFGSLGEDGKFCETTRYDPRSPYSASKAAADHLVRAYHSTYRLPVTVSNCSNNYGPFQFPEKVVPLMILNAVEGQPLPVYGDGGHVRDWLFVDDHCRAIFAILAEGRDGETYTVGGGCEKTNLALVQEICRLLEERLPAAGNPNLSKRDSPLANYTDLIRFVPDRPGHDRRYAIDFAKIQRELGWSPRVDLTEGLRRTIAWLLD
ncbi:MAG TPA: dTDP-glucose 4,6-dehydratase, partial [Candidatus Aminicenantes bacterium]|nr:dTDP-glucose 4,6-dehydratase [Candidatus Aminicenantes bacterium]